MLGVKLTLESGEDWNQKKNSLLEQKEVIEPELLEQISTALKVPAEAITSFDEVAAINVISSTFKDSSAVVNNNPIFNPIDKWLEALEENKKLYTALLQEKDEKIALLERVLEKKKK